MALYQCSIAGGVELNLGRWHCTSVQLLAGLNSASVDGAVPVFDCWCGVELSLGWREKNDAEKAVEGCVCQLAPEVRLHELHRAEASFCLNRGRCCRCRSDPRTSISTISGLIGLHCSRISSDPDGLLRPSTCCTSVHTAVLTCRQLHDRDVSDALCHRQHLLWRSYKHRACRATCTEAHRRH